VSDEKIYVVVYVAYDWWTFQENCYASTNKKDCYQWIKKNNPNHLPFYSYEKGSDDEAHPESHYWIEEFSDRTILETVKEGAQDLHDAGIIDSTKLKEYEKTCDEEEQGIE
jgi:hypothetical protein